MGTDNKNNSNDTNSNKGQLITEANLIKGHLSAIREMLRGVEITETNDAYLYEGVTQIFAASEHIFEGAVSTTRTDRKLALSQALIWDSVNAASELDSDTQQEMFTALHELRHACAAIQKILQRRRAEGKSVTAAA
jgi:hypothetical protein